MAGRGELIICGAEMTTPNQVAQSEVQIPPDVEALLGTPPVLRHEDIEAYRTLRLHVARAVAPADVIEWLWLRDIVDLSWEIQRLRRFKTLLIDLRVEARIGQYGERAAHAAGNFPAFSVSELAKRQYLQQQQSEREAKLREGAAKHYRDLAASELGAAGLFLESVHKYEDIDALIASAESRRTAVLREIERRRDSLALRLPKASDAIVEGEFTEPAGEPGHGDDPVAHGLRLESQREVA